MNFFERRKVLKRTHSGDLVPVRIVGHEEKDGRINLLVPKFPQAFWHWFIPRTREMFFRFRLDEKGTACWRAMDGEKTLSELAGVLKNTDPFSKEPDSDLLPLITKFAGILYENKYISFKQLMN
jgi:hypothetical protein